MRARASVQDQQGRRRGGSVSMAAVWATACRPLKLTTILLSCVLHCAAQLAEGQQNGLSDSVSFNRLERPLPAYDELRIGSDMETTTEMAFGGRRLAQRNDDIIEGTAHHVKQRSYQRERKESWAHSATAAAAHRTSRVRGDVALGKAAYSARSLQSDVPTSLSDAQTPRTFSPGLRLIVAAHRALFVLSPDSRSVTVLHEGHGHYYGAVSARAAHASLPCGALLVGSQSTNAQRSAEARQRLPPGDALLLIEREGTLARAWRLPSRYLHDTVLHSETDTSDTSGTSLLQSAQAARAAIHSVDTASGLVFKHTLSVGASGSLELQLQERLRAASSSAEHINSVAFGETQSDASTWVLRAMLEPRPSQLVRLRSSTNTTHRVHALEGPACHALVWWRGALLHLNSSSASIVALRLPHRSDPRTPARRQLLWSAGKGFFAKGLAVVDDVAFVGLSPRMAADSSGIFGFLRTQVRWNRNSVDSEVAAVDLNMGKLLWRVNLPRKGLVNSISAPDLHAESSWRAVYTHASDSSEARAQGIPGCSLQGTNANV